MTRSILLLSYHFPPVGGAGAQRAVQLARHLPSFGFRTIVVTGAGRSGDRWAPLDETLGRDLPDTVEVRRLDVPEPPSPPPWRSRVDRSLRRVSAWERWWTEEVLREARDAAEEVDLVHATLAPYQTAAAVRRIAEEVGRPLVVDLEDPWALDEMTIFPTGLHRRLELSRMGRTLGVADAIVMNTAEAARRVRGAFPQLRDRLVVPIPNAFDADDFRAPVGTRDDTSFRIVHTGSLHTELGLRHRRRSALRRAMGGAVPGVDYLTRSHVHLLDALRRASSERPDLVARAELHLAGVLTDVDLQVLEGSLVPVEAHGFLPHGRSIALIRSADLLVLPLHDVAPGTRVGIVPQKTYEYVAAGRPILAAVPPGDARDLLADVPTARVCRPSDVGAMAEALLAELDSWARGSARPTVPPAVAARHEARRMASEVAQLYREVLLRVEARSRAAAPRPRCRRRSGV